MKRSFFVLWFFFAALTAVARADDPDTDGTSIHVGALRRRLLAARVSDVTVLKWVVERQNSYPHATLDAQEFFDFYHDLLGQMTSARVDATEFLKATQTLYDAFRPSWNEVKRGIQAAKGTVDAKNVLVPNQSQFFLLHVPPDAPQLTVKGLAILGELPSLPAEHTASVWGRVLPGIIAPPDGISEADHFFAVYDGILVALSGHPEQLVEFYRRTAQQYRSFKPTAERIVQSARAISIAVGTKYNDRQLTITPETRDPLASYDFVWFHIQRDETLTDYNAATQLIQAFKKFVAEPNEFEGVKTTVRNRDYHNFDYYWGQSNQWVALKDAIKQRDHYLEKARGPHSIAILTSFKPAQVNQHHLARIESIVEWLDAMTDAKHAAHEFLRTQLYAATDLPSFDRLFHLLESRNQRSLAQSIADQRVGDLRDWNPPAERLRAVHGGDMVTAAKVREMNRPDYFLTLYSDALARHRWEDQEELEAFALERVEPFFASRPSVPQMWELLVLLRDKPTPKAREAIEQRALAAIKELPPEEARRAIHGYLDYKLGTYTEIERAPLRITEKEHRDRMRQELWATTQEARAGVYASTDIATLLGEWYAEVASNPAVPSSASLRILVLLADVASSTAAGFVGTAFASLQRSHWDEARYQLSSRLMRSVVNIFTPAAGVSSNNELARFTPDDWRLVRTAVKQGEACGTSLASAPAGKTGTAPVAPKAKRRWWLLGH